MKGASGRAILFLYEGETEGEFYPKVLKQYIDPKECKMRLSSQCLGGNFNINTKVINAIDNYLNYLKGKVDIKSLHVFVALDREKRAEFMAPIDLVLIRKQVKSSVVSSIDTIIATQDFESWLFIDIENIYRFLKAPVSTRNATIYKNYESFNNSDLSRLFAQHKKQYRKGKKVEGLLNAIDISKIYDNCQELRNGIDSIKKLCKKKK